MKGGEPLEPAVLPRGAGGGTAPRTPSQADAATPLLLPSLPVAPQLMAARAGVHGARFAAAVPALCHAGQEAACRRGSGETHQLVTLTPQ